MFIASSGVLPLAITAWAPHVSKDMSIKRVSCLRRCREMTLTLL
jgi:hypothetical protein